MQKGDGELAHYVALSHKKKSFWKKEYKAYCPFCRGPAASEKGSQT